MSYSELQPQQPGSAPAKNGLGLAGFIVSLVGIVTCGLLSPIGLVLSGIAALKPPRGFAIAGVIIGALGSLLLVLAGFGMVAGLAQMGGVKQVLETAVAVGRASEAIGSYQQENHELPDDEKGEELVKAFPDANGLPLRYKRLGDDDFEIRSAGADKLFDTKDDLTNKGGPPELGK